MFIQNLLQETSFFSEKGRLEGTSEIFERLRYNGKNGLFHRKSSIENPKSDKKLEYLVQNQDSV